MQEQLSLFNDLASVDKKVLFYGNYCNDDWSCKTKTVLKSKNIVDAINFDLTKAALKRICRKSEKIVRGHYGYEIFFRQNEIKQSLFVRFINYTTRKNRDVYEHIDLYFDKTAEMES